MILIQIKLNYFVLFVWIIKQMQFIKNVDMEVKNILNKNLFKLRILFF
jgi:hypothetical protein